MNRNWILRGGSEGWMLDADNHLFGGGGFQSNLFRESDKGITGFACSTTYGYWTRHKSGKGGGTFHMVPASSRSRAFRETRERDNGSGYSTEHHGNERTV